MISYNEAVDLIVREASAVPMGIETVHISSISGRICAADIVSRVDVPSFDNAAMDGFGLMYADAAKKLKVKARVTAGDCVETLKIASGECCEIMTGAPLPQGVDCVIQVEQTSREGDIISFTGKTQPGSHIRKRGSDFSAGDIIVKKGTKLGMRHVLPLAACGAGKIGVMAKPKVAFIPTGSEIADRLDETLADGKIYNSSLPYAEAFLTGAGAEFIACQRVEDDPARFRHEITSLMQSGVQLIISSGAVSAGSRDFIRSVLEEMGAKILFHKVAIKPGKPVLFAKLPNGVLYMGLPGNPVSTAAGLRFFVQPLLAAMTGDAKDKPLYARNMTKMERKAGLRLFLKAAVQLSPEAAAEAHILDGQESYKTAPFVGMNAWAVVPEDKASVDIGDIIEIYPLQGFY